MSRLGFDPRAVHEEFERLFGSEVFREMEKADRREKAARPRRCAYFLRAKEGGPIKIGYTTQPVTKRVAEFNPRYPYTLHVLLTIPGPPRLERFFHRRFHYLRLRGEWFRDDPELLAFIDEQRMARGQVAP